MMAAKPAAPWPCCRLPTALLMICRTLVGAAWVRLVISG